MSLVSMNSCLCSARICHEQISIELQYAMSTRRLSTVMLSKYFYFHTEKVQYERILLDK